MADLTSIIAVLLLQIVVLPPEPSSAAYVLSVKLYTYRNNRHRDSGGGCCDHDIWPPWRCNDCDNKFTLCLRDANIRDDNANNCPLGKDSFSNYHDTINFPPDEYYRFYSQGPWPGSALLYVRIVDNDIITRDDHVDDIYILIHLSPGQSIGPSTFVGDYGRSRFELSFQLSCQSNFYGEDCLTNCIPTDDDTGHFGCGPQGERLCLPGWRDPANHCLTPICEECNPIGGTCTAPGKCTCLPGWEGPQCTQCSKTSLGCSTEGGFCVRPGECQCYDGYGGDNCDVYLFPCKREPCQNGATCVNDGSGGYTCQCSSGYGGRNCTVQCESGSDSCTVDCNNLINPCENGGTCRIQTLGDGVNRSSCTCRQGFSGEYCEISVNGCLPNPCRNGGTCQDNSTSNYTCTCAEGYTGAHCEKDIDYCESEPCQNNGTCVDLEGSNYTCSCLDGWVGHDCGEERDECEEFKPCKNGATCTDLFDDYKCDCVPGYMGRDCEQEINECSPNPCKNGNCTDLLNNYTCQCFDKFTGKNCEIDLNSCRSAPCLNGGTCENEPDGFYVCTCPPGYTGFNCEVIERCLSSPCSNQGTCIDEEDDYYCICGPDSTGKDCSIPLNAAAPIRQTQSGVAMETIVGGVIGGVVLILVLLVFIIVAVYLLQKRKSNQYKAMSAVVYSVNGDGEGYDNPTYTSDIHIQEPGRSRQLSQGAPSDHTYSTLGNSLTTPLITGAQEEADQYGVDYHNFDNPLYADSQTVAESPTYNRTSLPGPRGPSISRRSAVGNDRSSSHHAADVSSISAVPGPMEYAYVGVNQQQEAAAKGRNGVARSDNQLQQDDAVYELITTDQ